MANILGNPGPFGLLCFGMTTNMLMFVITGWSEKQFETYAIAYAAFYGGFGQFVAGILEIIKGNTFAGTAFASYGCFWLGWFLLHMLSAPVANTGKALWCGLWAFMTLGFFVVSCKKNRCLQIIFSSLIVTFALLAAGIYNKNCEIAAGYIGFFCGTSALYAAFAMLYKDELGYELPGIQPLVPSELTVYL